MTTRDNQRTRLYRAEQEFHGLLARADDPNIPRFAVGDVAAVQGWVAQVLDSEAIVSEFNLTPRIRRVPRIVVGPGQRRSASYYVGSSRIILPPSQWGFSVDIVAHEVAHHITTSRHAPHGPEFARNQLTLFELAVSPHVGRMLADLYADHNVVVAPTRLERLSDAPVP